MSDTGEQSAGEFVRDSAVKIGIITCDRYRTCAGGKCFRALRDREGAFARYRGKELELVGFTSCSGCPGGNVEYAPAEMKKNGAEIIHLATGLVVGYPPCPRIPYFCNFIAEKYGLEVVVGTHPIPESYFTTHSNLKTWDSAFWKELTAPTLTDEKTRKSYN
jgi:predicted metal-binding protein